MLEMDQVRVNLEGKGLGLGSLGKRLEIMYEVRAG